MCRTIDLLEEIEETQEEDLLQEINKIVVGKLRAFRAIKTTRAIIGFKLGDQVSFIGNKRVGRLYGKIMKINRTTVSVKVYNSSPGNWTCPARGVRLETPTPSIFSAPMGTIPMGA